MRILLGFNYYNYPGWDVKAWVDAWLGRLRAAGFHVDSYPLNLNPPGDCLYWPELDLRWRRGDKKLLNMYEKLARTLENYDVFVNWNGINIHPDFVPHLPTFNVYSCFDDPELSELLSKPVAAAYDLAMVGNIAELDTYRSWGVKEVRHWPLGFFASDYDPSLTREKILNEERDIDITLLCTYHGLRADRINKFAAAFPHGCYYGKGWPNGFLPEGQRVSLYQRTKIGPNFHLSTGPINFRTFILPANGVMQICDNKSHLGKLFELGKEVIGFDTVEEAIELCRYYLNHDAERREIAAAGWERAIRDYNEVATFQILERAVKDLYNRKFKRKYDDTVIIYLKKHRNHTISNRIIYYLQTPMRLVSVLFKLLLKVLKVLKVKMTVYKKNER